MKCNVGDNSEDAMPRISIVVPVYNANTYLNRCIDSLLRQDYPSYDVILVNDGSTDNSLQICREYERKNAGISVIDQENAGPNGARLTGIKASKSEYIAFVDADDWIEAEYLTGMLEGSAGADIICGELTRIMDHEEYREKNEIAPGVYETEEERKQVCEDMLYNDETEGFGILPYACAKLYRRELLEEILEGVDARITDGEDMACICALLLRAGKIAVTRYDGYRYDYHEGSLSYGRKKSDYYNEACLYQYLYGMFSQSDYKEALIAKLNRYILMMIQKRDPLAYFRGNKIEFIHHEEQGEQGERIIIYGAGIVGNAVCQQIRRSGGRGVIAVADRKHTGEDPFYIAPEKIRELAVDRIFIAIDNSEIAEQVRTYLCEQGIPDSKITGIRGII